VLYCRLQQLHCWASQCVTCSTCHAALQLAPRLQIHYCKQTASCCCHSVRLSAEIIAFSDRFKEFDAIDCQVIAASTDTEECHLAWIKCAI
jgi:hypothetical protein